MNRTRKIIPLLALMLLCTVYLSGCGTVENQVKPALDKADQVITDSLEKLKEAEYEGGPFENNLDSARSYLLDELQEKYGVEFVIIGKEKLKNYGPFSGASYSCEAAPVDYPEQITEALVSQTTYQNVHDNYARYYFKEEAERPAYDLCTSKPYVLDQRISLEAPGTEKTWTLQDGLETYLTQSGAYVKIVLRLEDGLDAKDYAEQLLDFLDSVKNLDRNILLQAKANKTYIFHQEINLLDGDEIPSYSVEWLEEEIEEDLSMGSPVSFY